MSFFDSEAEKLEFISEIEQAIRAAASVAELGKVDDNYESCEPYHSLGLTYKLFDKALNDFGFSVAEQVSNVYNGEPFYLDQQTELGEFPGLYDVKRTETSKYVFDIILERIETAEDCVSLLQATDVGSERYMILFEKLFTYNPSSGTLDTVIEDIFEWRDRILVNTDSRKKRDLIRRVFDYADKNDL